MSALLDFIKSQPVCAALLGAALLWTAAAILTNQLGMMIPAMLFTFAALLAVGGEA